MQTFFTFLICLILVTVQFLKLVYMQMPQRYFTAVFSQPCPYGPVSTKCRLQTADCRLQTGYKMQTRYKMQTADYRLGAKCRLTFETVFFECFLTFYNLPVVTQSLFRCHIPRKLTLTGNDLAPLLEIYFSNEVSKINSFLNMI